MFVKEIYGSFKRARRAVCPKTEDGLVANGPSTPPSHSIRQHLGLPQCHLTTKVSVLTWEIKRVVHTRTSRRRDDHLSLG